MCPSNPQTQRGTSLQTFPTFLSASPSPRLPPEPEILIKVRALTTRRHEGWGWMSGWTVLWFHLHPTSDPVPLCLFLHSSPDFFSSCRLPPKTSSHRASDSTDRVVSQLTFSLSPLNPHLWANVPHIFTHRHKVALLYV